MIDGLELLLCMVLVQKGV